mgnify:CR=1 FL=1
MSTEAGVRNHAREGTGARIAKVGSNVGLHEMACSRGLTHAAVRVSLPLLQAAQQAPGKKATAAVSPVSS